MYIIYFLSLHNPDDEFHLISTERATFTSESVLPKNVRMLRALIVPNARVTYQQFAALRYAKVTGCNTTAVYNYSVHCIAYYRYT